MEVWESISINLSLRRTKQKPKINPKRYVITSIQLRHSGKSSSVQLPSMVSNEAKHSGLSKDTVFFGARMILVSSAKLTP